VAKEKGNKKFKRNCFETTEIVWKNIVKGIKLKRMKIKKDIESKGLETTCFQ
jgi:hypothetical protein